MTITFELEKAFGSATESIIIPVVLGTKYDRQWFDHLQAEIKKHNSAWESSQPYCYFKIEFIKDIGEKVNLEISVTRCKDLNQKFLDEQKELLTMLAANATQLYLNRMHVIETKQKQKDQMLTILKELQG